MNVPVTIETIESIIYAEVASVETIDVHTHLLPPSHGNTLCLWGIDELLTYHYLVSEYFMTISNPTEITPSKFYKLSKQKQANLIWQALFMNRSPISEACRGVITTLERLGLHDELMSRDLERIRQFYRSYSDRGYEGSNEFSQLVFNLSGVKYNVMTNIPFDTNEIQHWRPKRKEYSNNYRSALRIDPLLSGDYNTINNALRGNGYETTLDGARQYLRDWIETIKPEYMMASTPHDFTFSDNSQNEGGPLSSIERKDKTGMNEETLKQPFAFVDAVSGGAGATSCDGGSGQEDDMATPINENSNYLSDVLIPICEEYDLPIALKIGAHRQINPSLKQAGDGIVAFADGNMLARLCTRFNRVRFLATFLSRNNQHEACVLANKFGNLHIYGAWWYCNNPSIIEEITKMRIEMLGTAFTVQHSDARVLDQLIYKWSHSRSIVASVLVNEYRKLLLSSNGYWTITRGEIRRDVHRLFGGAYEEFMSKSFIPK